MMNFTRADLKAGHKAMEQSLTPVQKVFRKFLSGKPPVTPKNTPLAAVSLATEQRARLSTLLKNERLNRANVTDVGVVVRVLGPSPRPDVLADMIPVIEGKEGQAISTLEMYGEKIKRDFAIVGLVFAVRDGKGKSLCAYPIDRTPEGLAALQWMYQRQFSGRVPKGN